MFRRRNILLVLVLILAGCNYPAPNVLPPSPFPTFSAPEATATSLPVNTTAEAATPTSPAPTAAVPTATLEPTATGFSLGSMEGAVWHDLCAAGTEGQPAPASPPPGCVPGVQGGFEANGVLESGEPGIAGLTVELGVGACPSAGLATATTNANGAYRFEGLTAGAYCVSINPTSAANQATLLPGGWTYPQRDQGSATVNLRAGEQLTGANFGWDYQFLPVAAAGVTPVAGNGGTCPYRATFVADITIADLSHLSPGTQFVKTWRVRNDGTCTWGPSGYALNALAFVGGDQLGGPNRVLLPHKVSPGNTVDLSVTLSAPTTPGRYKSRWKLQFDNGTYLGTGADGLTPLYTEFFVDQPGPPNTPAPTSTPAPSGSTTRVSFAEGATSASVDGSLKANESITYVLRALQNQLIQLVLSSPGNKARMSLTEAQGRQVPILASTSGGEYLAARLPANGDYRITVSAGSEAAQYSLNIVIPARISFEPGAVSATVNGTTNARRTVTYILRAMANQTMTVNLTAPNNAAVLEIYGFEDGQPLLRDAAGQTTFTGTLPANQDYLVSVKPGIDTAFNYTLSITIR